MLIKKAHIKNFKGIKDLNIDFHPGFNLIKGENGKGKTSILEAIAIGLGGYLSGIKGVKVRRFSDDEIRREYNRTGDASLAENIFFPVEVGLDTVIEPYGDIQWTNSQKAIKPKRVVNTSPDEVIRVASEMSLKNDVELPIINYQSAGRVWNHKDSKTDIFREQYLRTVGYTDTLDGSANRKLFLNWCVKMEQTAWQKEEKIREYEAVKQAAADFMKSMDSSDCNYNVYYDKQFECIMFDDGNAVTPINELSAGYQSLIWMVLDIAYRMAVLNPFRLSEVTKTSGVVLIDELDMHLHPRWQWRVIDSLEKVFPNVQFIAATHSPILFSSSNNIWLIDVDGNEISYDTSHYGLDVNSSVERYQGEYMLPEKVNELRKKFYKEMDDGNYTSARKILDQTEEETAPGTTILIEMKTRYDLETGLLEEKA